MFDWSGPGARQVTIHTHERGMHGPGGLWSGDEGDSFSSMQTTIAFVRTVAVLEIVP